jgi:hypothetical protein
MGASLHNAYPFEVAGFAAVSAVRGYPLNLAAVRAGAALARLPISDVGVKMVLRLAVMHDSFPCHIN